MKQEHPCKRVAMRLPKRFTIALLSIALLLLAMPQWQVMAQAEIDFPKTRNVEKIGWSNNLVPTKQVKPRYPRRAAASGKDGWVHMTYAIDSTGSVHDVSVVESYPEDDFNNSAIKALERWEFAIPADMAGAKFPIKRQIVFTFQLNKQNGARMSVGRDLKRARKEIVDEKDAEKAMEYMANVSSKANDNSLNMYELAALEQTYALLAFSESNFNEAIERGERTLRFGNTLDDDNIVATHRLLFFSYFNIKQFPDAVRIYDDWLELDQSIVEAKFTPTIERIRIALNEGQEIVFE